MKRSEINNIIKEAKNFFNKHNFILPPFGYWNLNDWKQKNKDKIDEIIDRSLGWDITDFGYNDFWKTGICVFTIRNGNQENIKKGSGKTYAEKLFFLEVDQSVPSHTHYVKIEDVINRGGGLLGVELFNSKEDGTPDDSSNIILSKDGEKVEFTPGEHFYLKPGESITLVPGVYHKFWGSNEKVLVGEVSLANDDVNDNVFVEEVGRFPDIEEDEDPTHLLITDYDSFL